jgi:hypothetical protein
MMTPRACPRPAPNWWLTAASSGIPAAHSGKRRVPTGSAFPLIKQGFWLITMGAPGRIRTCGTRFRKPLLYPLSYEGLALIRA